jgi:hypothetical protein
MIETLTFKALYVTSEILRLLSVFYEVGQLILPCVCPYSNHTSPCQAHFNSCPVSWLCQQDARLDFNVTVLQVQLHSYISVVQTVGNHDCLN